MRARGSQRKQQRNGLNVIYCNGSSSRGALRLKGLINSLRGINKVSLIFQGAPGPSITILSPPQEPSTLSSHHSDNNTFPLVSVPPAIVLKVFFPFLPAPSLDKRLHFVSDNVAPNNSPMIKNCTLLYSILALRKQDLRDLNSASCLGTTALFYLLQKSLGFLCGQQPKSSCGSEDHWSSLPLQTRHSLLGHLQQHPHCVAGL